jgi:hypothetical protein
MIKWVCIVEFLSVLQNSAQVMHLRAVLHVCQLVPVSMLIWAWHRQ